MLAAAPSGVGPTLSLQLSADCESVAFLACMHARTRRRTDAHTQVHERTRTDAHAHERTRRRMSAHAQFVLIRLPR